MEHQLVQGVEKAFNWPGADRLGRGFARGALPEPKLCERLLTPHRLLDLVMRRSLAPHRLRVLTGGEDLHPQNYLTNSTARRGFSVPMADMPKLARLLGAGCTVVVDQVNTYDPILEVACRALQWWTREPVQANAYLTTGDAAGFRLHWDDHDVIIVQVAGEKSWEVRGLSRTAPLFRDAEPNLTPPDETLWAGTLRAGEVMHIPRGYWHQATRQDHTTSGYSLHITFGFPQRTGIDWLGWLVDQARTHEIFRRDLNHQATDHERVTQQRELNQAVARLVAESPISDYLTTREQRQPPARHVATNLLFGQPEQVVCVTDYPLHLEEHGETLIVTAADTTITFSAAALPVLWLLCSGRPISIDHASTVTGVDARAIATALLDAGICAEVTPELATGYDGLVTLPRAGAATSLHVPAPVPATAPNTRQRR